MSRHRRRVKHFDRDTKARKALWRGMIVSLVEHGRIKTTVDRAKEARRHVEKLITLGKKADVATTRLLMTRVPHQPTVDAIVKDISPRFKTRPGGYTRIIKIGRRPGDTAEMAFLEFVDYDYTQAGAGTADKAAATDKKKAPAKKAAVKTKKATGGVIAKKKSAKKQQKKSRVAARA